MTKNPRHCNDRGQSTVEFALVLPLLAVVLVAFVQVGLVVVSKISVIHTAREVARVMAVNPEADPDAVAAAVSLVDPADLSVTVSWETPSVTGRDQVVVKVIHRITSITGLWAPILETTTTVTMVRE